MKVTLDIKKSRFKFFLELINNLDFVKIVDQESDEHENELHQRLQNALKEVNQHQKGEIQLQSAKEFLNEL